MKKNAMLVLAILLLMFISCSSDDDDSSGSVTAPETYNFMRDGSSTVSFDGQTTRILMAGEIGSALKDNTKTVSELNAMFAHVAGNNDFSTSDLNATGKNVRSKVAASIDFFSGNTTASAEIKANFDSYIANQVSEVFPNWNSVASAGVAGGLDQIDGTTRYMNGKGLEYNQAFTKGVIGAMMMDQILNGYLSPAVLDAGDNVVDNNNDVLISDKNYTTMEHKWDESYGYLYGTEDDATLPSSSSADDFLNKYVKRVADNGFPNLPTEIFNAFKLGRAAITEKNYTVRDQQAEIIKEKISMAIALRAVHYLQSGKADLFPTVTDRAHGFHGLSEAVGFINSLQFTRQPNSTDPYLTKSEVDGMISQLMTGNGFWDVTETTLDSISNDIITAFNNSFTIAQAAQ